MSNYDVERRIHLIKTFLSSINTSGLRCLEVGCGTGKVSEAICPLIEDYVVSDISEKLARSIGERLGLDWMKMDACTMDIPINTFDLVI
jgi:ubiquinone/menaquinone biosynthesis C-methylase UbiE